MVPGYRYIVWQLNVYFLLPAYAQLAQLTTRHEMEDLLVLCVLVQYLHHYIGPLRARNLHSIVFLVVQIYPVLVCGSAHLTTQGSPPYSHTVLWSTSVQSTSQPVSQAFKMNMSHTSQALTRTYEWIRVLARLQAYSTSGLVLSLNWLHLVQRLLFAYHGCHLIHRFPT